MKIIDERGWLKNIVRGGIVGCTLGLSMILLTNIIFYYIYTVPYIVDPVVLTLLFIMKICIIMLIIIVFIMIMISLFFWSCSKKFIIKPLGDKN